jgi:hypothetical protein
MPAIQAVLRGLVAHAAKGNSPAPSVRSSKSSS